MDSLTQMALGAALAAACVPKPDKRKAIVIGAALGTLPDLDVLIDYGNAVTNFTQHRGFSHSLFILLPVSIALWGLLRQMYAPVRNAPIPWLCAILLVLLTHPILDAHTAYGTQLFWPMESPPIMWSTIFIIDPLYTLPLLAGAIAIGLRPAKAWANRGLVLGIVLSTGYLAWTWVAKYHVQQQINQSFTSHSQADSFFSTPILFTSLLWRVVVLQNDGSYLEGYYSFLNPDKTIDFTHYPKNNTPFNQAESLPDAQRLLWFSQGFSNLRQVDDKLVISDLRMGFETSYVFNHVIARVKSADYVPMQSQLLPMKFNPDNLTFLWRQLVGKTVPD